MVGKTRPTSQAVNEHLGRAGTAITATGILVALSCIAFAIVNVVFEVTGRFDQGRYVEYAAAFTVMNWLVVCLKLVGAAVAVASVLQRHLVASPALTVLLWGGFATLATYGLGSVLQMVGMALGISGSVDDIDLIGIAYVSFFLVVAAGFGALAISYSKRHRSPRRLAALGVLGAPALIGAVLLGMPALLTALGLMPAS